MVVVIGRRDPNDWRWWRWGYTPSAALRARLGETAIAVGLGPAWEALAVARAHVGHVVLGTPKGWPCGCILCRGRA